MTTNLPRAESVQLTPSASRQPVPLNDVAVILNSVDQVAVAKTTLLPGSKLILADGSTLRVSQLIPTGHKVALRAIAFDEPIRKYGQIIGFAIQEIAPGQHVHSQNLAVKDFSRDYDFSSEYKPVEMVPESERRTFRGFRRADGRVGTRNYVAVLASVNCSSSATVAVADYFKQPGALDAFPNVDGVLALPHKGGCGAHVGSQYLHNFQRTLAGTVNHPNVAAYVMLSLGCEGNQPDDMIEYTGLEDPRGGKPQVITIQQDGGYLKTVEAGIEAVKKLLPVANEARREPVPASELVVALQCGGSDGWSGVTANPVPCETGTSWSPSFSTMITRTTPRAAASMSAGSARAARGPKRARQARRAARRRNMARLYGRAPFERKRREAEPGRAWQTTSIDRRPQ